MDSDLAVSDHQQLESNQQEAETRPVQDEIPQNVVRQQSQQTPEIVTEVAITEGDGVLGQQEVPEQVAHDGADTGQGERAQSLVANDGDENVVAGDEGAQAKRSCGPNYEQEQEFRRLRQRLGRASHTVGHFTYLVSRLKHSQALRAVQRASGCEEALGPGDRRALAEAHAKRVSDIISKQCLSVLKALQGHKWGWPFNHPVDTQQYTDYLKVISHPMDLGTMRQRIESGHYTDPEQFAADARLVFANAKLYNPPGSDVHIMASTLKGRFEERWQSLVVPKIADEMNTCKTEEVAAERRALEMRRVRDAEAHERESRQLLHRIEELEANIAEDKAAAAFLCPPLPEEARDRLRRELGALDDNSLAEVVGIVLERYPGLAPRSTSGAVDIDLGDLDALTLRLARIAALRSDPQASEKRRKLNTGSCVPRFRPPRSVRLAKSGDRGLVVKAECETAVSAPSIEPKGEQREPKVEDLGAAEPPPAREVAGAPQLGAILERGPGAASAAAAVVPPLQSSSGATQDPPGSA
uniref:Bromodomain-containing protein 2 n=1 Tax=Tetraselmis sp. GSL018 TaxID=582737 RepID=A0A061R1V5_9CHLO|eukprot:CAMPEP_0177607082 /NCGR_PEP_ID=MMETSP0419_2-20121207/17708_1 /TAXON_ID=582737 /ORGANISM="Tetraselmis sp., Strain GSL018" /LENGTH=525 /DNA_ID=CAMNT_0019101601 /DNA_START=244 /DNA_END=1824 /DNA_ORIENTATION=+